MRPLLVTCAAMLALAAAAAANDRPARLDGVPLRGPTGLHLLVANDPPFVFDVDGGKARRLRGIPSAGAIVSVQPVAGRGAVVSVDEELYGVRDAGTAAVPLGPGSSAVGDGGAVWVKRRLGGTRCTLRQVALDGRVLRTPRTVACGWTLDAGGDVGLVASRTRVVDPTTLRTVVRTRGGVVAAAGRHLVLAGTGDPPTFTLLDTATGTRSEVGWPSVVTGLDRAAVDPRGRHVALGFASPVWAGGGRQVTDVWILDAGTGRLDQLPGMPAFVHLKATDMNWTSDGRLVILAEDDRRTVVAVWRPGERRLAVRAIDLPERDGSSDSFAPLG